MASTRWPSTPWLNLDKLKARDSLVLRFDVWICSLVLRKDVKQVYASSAAFAAILADGSLVTWGDPERGGDSSAVRDQMQWL